MRRAVAAALLLLCAPAPASPPDLLLDAATENERRAALWALAQVDVKPAWDALRRIAKEHGDPRVRELAQRSLDQPRTALLLAP